MTTNPIPTAEEILTPAIDELVRLRPLAVNHIDRGIWGDLLYGLKGQARVFRAELARAYASRWLNAARGAQLLELVRSTEFGATLATSESTALGHVVLQRAVTGATTAAPEQWLTVGVIQGGQGFRVPATSSPFTVPEGLVEAIESVPVGNTAASGVVTSEEPGGTWRHEQTIQVEVRATSPGAGSNIPSTTSDWWGKTAVVPESVGKLFDRNLTPIGIFMGGGSSGISDEAVRACGRAAFMGSRFPVDQALVAAALGAGLGVERAIHVDDVESRSISLFIADSSWGASPAWARIVGEAIANSGAIGFGCRTKVFPLRNIVCSARVAVSVAGASSLASSAQISSTARAALVEYLDTGDFWRASSHGAGAAVALALRSLVESVSAVALVDSQGKSINLDAEQEVAHLYLEAVTVDYYGPSGLIARGY